MWIYSHSYPYSFALCLFGTHFNSLFNFESIDSVNWQWIGEKNNNNNNSKSNEIKTKPTIPNSGRNGGENGENITNNVTAIKRWLFCTNRLFQPDFTMFWEICRMHQSAISVLRYNFFVVVPLLHHIPFIHVECSSKTCCHRFFLIGGRPSPPAPSSQRVNNQKLA